MELGIAVVNTLNFYGIHARLRQCGYVGVWLVCKNLAIGCDSAIYGYVEMSHKIYEYSGMHDVTLGDNELWFRYCTTLTPLLFVQLASQRTFFVRRLSATRDRHHGCRWVY